jgi:hypothetical protein
MAGSVEYRHGFHTVNMESLNFNFRDFFKAQKRAFCLGQKALSESLKNIMKTDRRGIRCKEAIHPFISVFRGLKMFFACSQNVIYFNIDIA